MRTVCLPGSPAIFSTFGIICQAFNQRPVGQWLVSLAEDGTFLSGKLIPTKQEGKGVPMPDETGRGAKLVRQLTLEDFPKTGVRIDPTTFELSR